MELKLREKLLVEKCLNCIIRDYKNRDDVEGNRFGRLFCSLIKTPFPFGAIVQNSCSKGPDTAGPKENS